MQTRKLSDKFSILAHHGQPEDMPWMELALQQARLAAQAGEVPIGAVVVIDGKAIAHAHNAPVTLNDACAHAEIQAIRHACQAVGNYRLGAQATLYVTLQPCLMCVGAILHARIGRVVVGCSHSRYNGDLKQSLSVFEQAQAWHPCVFETACMAQESEELLGNFLKCAANKEKKPLLIWPALCTCPMPTNKQLTNLRNLAFTLRKIFCKPG